ncbi:hypothetical protein HNQ75_004411 [Rhizobium flavum]|uniref:Uncharacterized protein n=1 Tax=Pseudorhizobium flavum TaxID=1335061 RepID=A0A7W9Z1Y1_9HYPH|nr:hypothetical protein [Pseudorhizobium flavum]CAD6599268.1 hypothetical protein RFYW14_00658 [Pseudorhizobium flavum]
MVLSRPQRRLFFACFGRGRATPHFLSESGGAFTKRPGGLLSLRVNSCLAAEHATTNDRMVMKVGFPLAFCQSSKVDLVCGCRTMWKSRIVPAVVSSARCSLGSWLCTEASIDLAIHTPEQIGRNRRRRGVGASSPSKSRERMNVLLRKLGYLWLFNPLWHCSGMRDGLASPTSGGRWRPTWSRLGRAYEGHAWALGVAQEIRNADALCL